MVNGDVVEVEPESATWWHSFHLGYADLVVWVKVGGRGWVFGVKRSRPSLSLDLFISLQGNGCFACI
jgi:hypothetical protein